MKTETRQVWSKNAEGKLELVETQVFEVEEPTVEELIAEKEAKLLEMYEELQALKAK